MQILIYMIGKLKKGEKIGIISYKSLFLANEIEVNEKLKLAVKKMRTIS